MSVSSDEKSFGLQLAHAGNRTAEALVSERVD